MPESRTLKISFHGRIIEQLGIQMYQKPIAAIAELVSNAWDADATVVTAELPTESINANSTITVQDNGNGMTFVECEQKFLNVGRSRRGENPDERSPGGRPVLGRKGIGKFAGFGIATKIEVTTTSKATGEKTRFLLDVDQLVTNEYVSTNGDIEVIEYLEPDDTRKAEHGTTIVLHNLKLQKRRDLDSDLKSMARRFLLAQRSDNFKVTINGQDLPEMQPDEGGVDFVFPAAYEDPEYNELLTTPANTTIRDGWGYYTLPNGEEVKWQLHFYKMPIQEKDLQGIAVYSKGKLAQSPFFFNVTGGLSGQHGQQYVSGQVEADFVDSLDEDLISPERQRINWDNARVSEFEAWGIELVKKSLSDWKKLRQRAKHTMLRERLADFSPRLERLQPHERKTIESAIDKVASVESLDDSNFIDIGDAMLTAWEKGRLHELISSLSEVGDMPEAEISAILLEARILSAISTSEAIKTKLVAIDGLKERVSNREPENAIRDYIAEDAWLISPELEFFKKETQVRHLLDEAKNETSFDDLDGYRGRADLALSSGKTLVIIEFMRPGLTLDWDHVSRFKQYTNILRSKIAANTTLGFDKIEGYIVADKIDSRTDVRVEITDMAAQGWKAMDWKTLIAVAADKWKDYLDAVIARTPEDIRLTQLALDFEATPAHPGTQASEEEASEATQTA